MRLSELTMPLGGDFELAGLRADYNPAWGILFDPWSLRWMAINHCDYLESGSADGLREQLDARQPETSAGEADQEGIRV